MAGGKETPRQKLIGMMYLVLTALLALQVSSAIILKFKFLDDSLMAVNGKTNTENVNRVQGIDKAVAERKGAATAKDKRVLTDAQEVRAKTGEIIKYLDDTRAMLIQKSGGMENGQYKDPSAEDLVAITMIGADKGKGEAYKMKDRLNAYSEYLKKFNPNMPKLGIDAKEDTVAS